MADPGKGGRGGGRGQQLDVLVPPELWEKNNQATKTYVDEHYPSQRLATMPWCCFQKLRLQYNKKTWDYISHESFFTPSWERVMEKVSEKILMPPGDLVYVLLFIKLDLKQIDNKVRQRHLDAVVRGTAYTNKRLNAFFQGKGFQGGHLLSSSDRGGMQHTLPDGTFIAGMALAVPRESLTDASRSVLEFWLKNYNYQLQQIRVLEQMEDICSHVHVDVLPPSLFAQKAAER